MNDIVWIPVREYTWFAAVGGRFFRMWGTPPDWPYPKSFSVSETGEHGLPLRHLTHKALDREEVNRVVLAYVGEKRTTDEVSSSASVTRTE